MTTPQMALWDMKTYEEDVLDEMATIMMTDQVEAAATTPRALAVSWHDTRRMAIERLYVRGIYREDSA